MQRLLGEAKKMLAHSQFARSKDLLPQRNLYQTKGLERLILLEDYSVR